MQVAHKGSCVGAQMKCIGLMVAQLCNLHFKCASNAYSECSVDAQMKYDTADY